MNAFLEYRLDIALFVLATVLATLLVRRQLRRIGATVPTRAIVALALLVLLTIGLAVLSGEGERGRLVRMVSGLAPTYALELHDLGLQSITPETAPDDPIYLNAIRKQKNWLATNPTMADIYAFVRDPDGTIRFTVDSETDYDRDGIIDHDREERTSIGEVYEDATEAMHTLFVEGRGSFDSSITVDRWGAWVSAIEPVYDSGGRVYAGIGVDFPAQDWVSRILIARAAVLLLGGVVTAILLTASFMNARLRTEAERRLRSENALRASESRLRLIVDNEPECVMVMDREGRLLEVNPAGQRVLSDHGKGPNGRSVFDFISPAHADAFAAHLAHVSDGNNAVIEFQMIDPTGKSHTFWMETHSVPLRDEGGTVVSMLSVARDVTARKNAERERESLQQQLVDASRHAGMAEIATGVLHNVGNVLNSVNVSAKIIRDRVRDSRQVGVTKLASLITDNASDLSRFIAEDPRGKQLPAYIQQLSSTLTREREQIETEIDQLMSGIQHISEVVRMQQNCARNSTVLTEISPVQIMEEALRVNLVAMERHRIEVSKRYSDPGPLMLDKHKILPALVNFISNAKQATSGVAITDRRITLHVRMEESNVVFEVEDNGSGIAPEVMPKLFRHGFTTKSDGHGFGLHSAANAAKEMGGGVSVSSDGPGRGAVFTLRIPAPRAQRREAA